MRKSKLERFAELNTYTNVLQNFNFREPFVIDHTKTVVDPKGKWRPEIFSNANPVILELACGKGEYTCAMAMETPDKNFIGVDVKGNRMHRGAKKALEEHITNAFFLRTDINILPSFFAENEVDEIWITFPDPHLKRGKEQKRLSSKYFLDLYRKILKPKGLIHLKTDDTTLYEFTLQTIEALQLKLIYACDDIYSGELFHPYLSIKTYYENSHLQEGKKIKYIQFEL